MRLTNRPARRRANWILGVLVAVTLIPAAAPRVRGADEPAPLVDDYVIGVEDRLQISVWREPELSLDVVVRPDGKITVPLVGDVQAAGRTATQVADELKSKLAVLIKQPVVTVIVAEINSFRVYVIGEVNRQGVLQLARRVRLLQALALAGGLSQFADKSNIVLVREENGNEVRRRIDYRKLIREEDSSMNIYVKPGDTIIVN
jgi:polysaccharide export outer membrane protein